MSSFTQTTTVSFELEHVVFFSLAWDFLNFWGFAKFQALP